jgi:hypothetical protein
MSRLFAIACVILAPLSSAIAATVTFKAVSGLGPGNPNVTVGRAPSSALIAAGVPADARIHEFLVTTDADILQIQGVHVERSALTPLYNLFDARGGSDTEPPSPLFYTLVPELAADSWVTTPGPTSQSGLGTGRPLEQPNEQWFDTTNEGPVVDFMFARITVFGEGQLVFRGHVQVIGRNGPENFPFRFYTIPEPASQTIAAASLLGLAARRRRT